MEVLEVFCRQQLREMSNGGGGQITIDMHLDTK